jgi:predicted enzyme related to lactoylglutathione lyase
VLFAKDMDRVAAFYAAVLGFKITGRDAKHVRLESDAFQLVVHALPDDIAVSITIATPPVPREDAAIKLVFFVLSIAEVRRLVAANGGVMDDADQEWSLDGWKVCDGVDPEGNVIQLRARGGSP